MTNILLKQRNSKAELIMDGHSDYAVFGEDIVCSGISILMYILANHPMCNVEDMADGMMHLTFTSSGIPFLHNVAIGFKAIADDYPSSASFRKEVS